MLAGGTLQCAHRSARISPVSASIKTKFGAEIVGVCLIRNFSSVNTVVKRKMKTSFLSV